MIEILKKTARQPLTHLRLLRWWFPGEVHYSRSRSLFIRGMGLIYLTAIVSWWVQAPALIGREGLVPVVGYLDRVEHYFAAEGGSAFWNVPTVFWLNSSDPFIQGVCIFGMLLSVLVMVGVFPGPCLFGLWVIYLSLVTTGNVFMSFQWDILLLEAGVLAILAAPWAVMRLHWHDPPPPGLGERIALWLCWFLVAKLMFESGWVKLAWASSRHPEWWPDRTALTYHYMTQPLPAWTAWWMYQLPVWFHKACLWPMYFVELILPFFVFLGMRLRLLAAAGFTALMLVVLLTGNYTYFNGLTLVLCLPLIADRFWGLLPGSGKQFRGWLSGLRRRLPGLSQTDDSTQTSALEIASPAGLNPEVRAAQTPLTLQVFAGNLVRAPLLLLLITLNFTIVLNDLHQPAQLPYLKDAALPWTHLEKDFTPSWADALRTRLAPFYLASGYGLFRTMTIDRPEIILEGSNDAITWREYELRWKPGRLDARPRFVAPHQPRVAWQFWFAALERRFNSRSSNAPWMVALLRGLLNNNPSALGFFKSNPFPDEPPKYLRAKLYLYDFTSQTERRETGNWWKRKPDGDYLPILTRDSFQ